ncbi:MAG: AAA family ATPase [Solirubrobacteraceae bacterium]
MVSSQDSDRSAGARREDGHSLTTDFDHPSDVTGAAFLEAVTRGSLRFLRRCVRPVADESLDGLDELGSEIARYRGSDGLDYRVIAQAGAVTQVELRHGSAHVCTAAGSDLAAVDANDRVADLLRPPQEPEDEIDVSFWSENGHGGGRSATRRIKVTSWEDVASTQAGGPRAELARLMGTCEPGGGRLVLWHGEPGTGKTYALKALVREWSSWCVPHFVTDPDDLLNGGSGYLMDVLTARDPAPRSHRQWRLVILEDSGELLAPDAREKTGQALSRLLNATDGFIGQGTNALVLVTTNEELGTLHPAVTRPGRCLAEIEFEPLAVEEANAWLMDRGSKLSVTVPTTIAELFSILAGRAEPRVLRPFGFAA